MLPGPRSLLLGIVLPVLMAGCGSSSYGLSAGPATPVASAATTTSGTPGSNSIDSGDGGTLAGTDDLIVATLSQPAASVVINASQTISVTFVSSDGKPMTGFAISAGSGALPAGWSGPSTFNCTSVSTGSGCVLNLTYAPVAVDSGTLTINYVEVDNSGMARTNGAISIAYAATPSNNVVAAASPTGQIDAVVATGMQAVSVNFTTDDGNPATNLAISTDLTELPAGWTSTAPTLSCPIVGTGSGCQLALTYAPTTAGHGTLTLTYSYTDDSGAAKTGTLNIPYFTTSTNTVIASAAPAGQIIAVQKTGSESVPVTFTTDNGKPASNLTITSSLTSLAPGWTSGSSNFTCASVSTGNGCRLTLNFAPSALVSGTLALNYAYDDGSGAARTGQLNIAYAATTNDNVVGTAAPAGPINAVVDNAPQSVAVTFTTDDGRSATALQLTSSLTAVPAGWSSPAGSFTCSALDADSLCQLTLNYDPAAAAAGTLTLSYSYENNADELKTGSVNIAYRATTNDNVIATATPSALAVSVGSSTSVNVVFTTDDGNPASNLSLGAALASLPPGWTSASNSFNCASVSTGTSCMVSLTYAPTVVAAGTLSLAFSYASDSGAAKTGAVTIAYGAVGP
jgi:hypothetical protein